MKQKYIYFFLFVLLLLFFIYGFSKICSLGPYSIHQWRQADCVSLTQNYFKENRDFLTPAIHWSGEKEGRTVSEFPLIYYTVAKLWKLFGHHYFIFRMIDLFFVYSGLFCLFLFLRKFLSDIFWSICIPTFLFTSPILVYYSFNFTADAPALGIALTASYFYWIFFKTQKRIWQILSISIFLLGGLIKISSLLIFLSLFFLHFVNIIKNKKKQNIKQYLLEFTPYIVLLFLTFAWYRYATTYNNKNISGIFLQNIYPIWELNKIEINDIWDSFFNNLLPAFFNKKALYSVLLIFLSLFYFYKKVNKFLFYLNIIVFLGVISYILLFYQAFTVHDYYLTNLLIFIPIPLITILDMLKREYPKVFYNKFLKITFSIVLGLLIFKTSGINRMKYDANSLYVQKHPFLTKSDINDYSLLQYSYGQHLKTLEEISPYLNSIGINRNDKVLSIPDPSINISLMLMDQKGYSEFGFNELSFEQKVEHFKKFGLKYLIVNDSTIYKQEYIKPYIIHKIGQYKNIGIFDILK